MTPRQERIAEHLREGRSAAQNNGDQVAVSRSWIEAAKLGSPDGANLVSRTAAPHVKQAAGAGDTEAPAVQKWLLVHPRVQLHFTPTCASRLNQIERWFAELQRRCLDRGVFCSLDELTTALENWINT